MEFYPFPPVSRPNFDNLTRELDADGLRAHDAPLVFDKAMEETGSVFHELLIQDSFEDRRVG